MSDLIERLRRLYVQNGTNYVQEAADEIERLTAAAQHEADCVEAYRAQVETMIRERDDRTGTHAGGCADWGPAHYECAIRERDELRDVLLRGGFVPCDIPACNCGSWHHRYGLPERMQEIKDALAEAGHELSNANGNLPINALKALVSERDELRRQLAEAELDAQRYRWLSGDLCPDHSVRWTQWEVRCWRAPQWTADLRRGALDAAIDAAMGGSDA